MKFKLIAFALLTSTFAAFGQEQEIKQRFVEVVGYSKLEITPDIATFSILLADNPKENISVEKQEIEIAKVLKKYGIPSDNLTIDKMNGVRQKVSFWGTKDIVNRKLYELKLNNLSVSDKVLDELSNLKIASIKLVKLESSQIESYKMNAFEIAARNAKEKASAIAKGLGQNTLSTLTVYEQSIFVSGEEEENQPRMYMMMEKAADSSLGAGTDEVQQSFKSIVVKCSLRARIELK